MVFGFTIEQFFTIILMIIIINFLFYFAPRR